MGYDMTMTKVKKSDLDTLKKQHPKASLSDLWEMLITYYTEKEFEDEYVVISVFFCPSHKIKQV